MKPYYCDEKRGVMLYLGQAEDVLPQFADRSIDVCITDPPFSERTHTGARTARNYGFSRGESTKPLITFAPLTRPQLEGVFAHLSRLTRRWVVSFLDYAHVVAFEQAPPTGLRFVRFGVWVKPNSAPQFSGDRPAQGWEGIAIMHHAEGAMRWNGGGSRAVWTYPKAQPAHHPAEKPIALMRDLIRKFSDPGDLLVDPFAGSGATLVAASLEGRRALGVEVSEEYCARIARRLALGEAAAQRPQQGVLNLDLETSA